MLVENNVTDRYFEKNKNKVIIFFIIMISIFLNHSNAIFGVNMSFADIFIVFSLIVLIYTKNLKIPIFHLLFFILLSINLLFMANVYMPIKFNIVNDFDIVMLNYIKVFVTFLYLLIGYNISRINEVKTCVKWYSVTGFLIGMIGMFFNLLNINMLDSVIYYGSSRFRGLMIDPNYYAVIQISTMPYFLKNNDIKFPVKIIMYIFYFIFIIMSGSKTGLIILLLYTVLFLTEDLIVENKSKGKYLGYILTIVILTFSFPIIKNYIFLLKSKLIQIFPISERVLLLFEDFNVATSEGGSIRNTVWLNAINIFKLSPLFGVGVGTYSNIGEHFFNNKDVAHNTYLQLFPEWGLLFSLIFFGYIFFILIKTTFIKNKIRNKLEVLITRDIFFVFLLGSLGISLNNARMFWLFLGILIYENKKNNLILL